jgi:hypothetical protein
MVAAPTAAAEADRKNFRLESTEEDKSVLLQGLLVVVELIVKTLLCEERNFSERTFAKRRSVCDIQRNKSEVSNSYCASVFLLTTHFKASFTLPIVKTAFNLMSLLGSFPNKPSEKDSGPWTLSQPIKNLPPQMRVAMVGIPFKHVNGLMP